MWVMLQLALHILDIVENSTRAGAKLVRIGITEDLKENVFRIEIEDDGRGMEPEKLRRVLDPFYTTKTVRRVGLGLPMLYQATQQTGGRFAIDSKVGEGTRVCAEFGHTHIDRQPLGDIAGTIVTLIAGNTDVDFQYVHRKGDLTFTLDTREIRNEIDDIPINHPEVLNFIRNSMKEGLAEIGANYE
ncbi:MAG: Nitrogen fixation regulatory protein [Syntrophaceae bacterium PtaU1.Bin231]|nr:MAG: Nitrogen fixation regulatory protein [Syntrophaceae bacterium PtaU1.Bin231]